jgi:hypothetical protein
MKGQGISIQRGRQPCGFGQMTLVFISLISAKLGYGAFARTPSRRFPFAKGFRCAV